MEYVGRRVKRKFQLQNGTSFGSVESYQQSTGLFRIVYDDGDCKELELAELHSLIDNEGTFNDISVIESDVSGSLVNKGGVSRKFDLNLNEDDLSNLNENDDHGGREVRGGGGGAKLHGLDLNERVNLDSLDGVDLNKGLFGEESSGVKKEMIDLNVAINEVFEDLGGEKKERSFDLNLDLMEEEVKKLDECEVQSRVNETVDVQMSEDFAENDNKEIIVISDDDEGNGVSNMENEGENPFKNWASVVSSQNVASVSAPRKSRTRKKKGASNNIIELATREEIIVDVESGKLKLLESRDETPLRICNTLGDGANRVLGSSSRGRGGRKKIDLPANDIPITTPETGLRSSRRAKLNAPSGQGHVYRATGLYAINDQMSSPAISAVSNENIRGKSAENVMLPPKVELPPSSSNLDIPGVSAFKLVSVYAFLRSFSILLFLSPFELDDFVACLKCDDSPSLFDSIHVSLLKTLRKHLESLSYEGSVSASKCLRSLNWDFLDLITWPMFVVEYLLLHSPGYIPGVDLCNVKPFQSDYYKLPVSAKVDILRLLCDDVIEVETFRSDLNRRTDSKERNMDLERNMKFENSKKRKAVLDVASSSCLAEEVPNEPTDYNGDECRLCKMDGNLICCDGCPAAFHARCVGVVSSLLPEGDWYCPECVIEKDKPWLKMGMLIRGAEVLGTDPYGRKYYSSCGYLLVLESYNDDVPSWSYNKNDLPTLIKALESSPFVYDTIISAICKNWNIVHGVVGTKNGLDSRSSTQSAFPEKRQPPDMHQRTSETDEAVAEKWSDKKSLVTAYFSKLETENAGNVTVTLETGNLGAKMENRLANSEGSAEVSQAFMKTDSLKESAFGCSKARPEIPEDSQIPLKLGDIADHCLASAILDVEQGNNLNSENYSYALSAINSKSFKPQVQFRTNYVNSYEFAQIASSVLGKLAFKSSDKISEDAPRSFEESVASQHKLITNRFANFSWSNIQNSNMNYRKEKCGWCFYCKAPEEERNCLFIMSDRFPSAENFMSEALGIGFDKNREIHLIDVICHMICIEDHLQGLLLGPWLTPHYSIVWRKSVGEAVNIGSLKILLLLLESNLHHLALSSDWRKHVDSVATMGSASHIVINSTQASSRNARSSGTGISPPSKADPGLRLFWWRGGTGSRKLFNWKVLPRNLASKAGRQGGCKKIPGILYPESGENVKRTRYDAWRAAVETSRSVDQLALQIRELDANIRWKDIGNSNILSKKKSVESFKKATVRRKRSDGTLVKYLLDFGKRRHIPNIVVKHGSIIEDISRGRKKYWLEESHVPLHLLKAYEEKRLARKASKTKPTDLQPSIKVTRRQKKGFEYLFSKLEKTGHYQCGQCNCDVLMREAVSCQDCKGFFHETHVRKSAGSITAACIYTCHKCERGNLVKNDARKGKSEVSEPKNEFEGLKQLHSGKGKKLGKGKQEVNPENKKIVPLAPPSRRSVRNAKRVVKFSLEIAKGKKGKNGKKGQKGQKGQKGKQVKSEMGNFPEPNTIRKKKRTPFNSIFWSKGLQLSRRPNDERLMHFRSKMLLVIPGGVISVNDKPKCSLCSELNYSSNLCYVACEICGVWFHGDALDLTEDKIDHLIGFKCHKCLNKRPPVCPHIGESSTGQKSGSNDEHMDIFDC
ncbi:hypothetical protein ACJIZ3_012810 [Penstemon smallii]|uniref:Uncharacterized protein n=1 Tax=Penstemon smallii TaxID=265156 RepID=A0ABD3UR03_9LAMI